MPLIAAIVAISVGASIYQGERAASEAKRARGEASKKAEEEVARQKTERERLQRKQSGRQQRDLNRARTAGAARRGGVAGTRLTGAGGIDPSLLNLAQNTLLG